MLTVSKLELAKSPYLESFSAATLSLRSKYHRSVQFGDELCQAISERKRAQSIVKELQRRITSLQTEDPSRKAKAKSECASAEDFHTEKMRKQAKKDRLLEELRERVKRETEESRMRAEESRERLLQQRRVTSTQQNVLRLKESLLEERRLSPARRQAKRECEPRFSSPEGKKVKKQKGARPLSQASQYDEVLKKEKSVLDRLKTKVSDRQISRLMKEANRGRK